MFKETDKFNGNIRNWETDNVEDMSEMFSKSEKFNGQLQEWNVRNVRDMHGMFEETREFAGGLGTWDTAQVGDMSHMFTEAKFFNGNVDGWDVANVEDMSYMFQEAAGFKQNLDNWHVGKVTKLDGIFDGATFCDSKKSAFDKWGLNEEMSKKMGMPALRTDEPTDDCPDSSLPFAGVKPHEIGKFGSNNRDQQALEQAGQIRQIQALREVSVLEQA